MINMIVCCMISTRDNVKKSTLQTTSVCCMMYDSNVARPVVRYHYVYLLFIMLYYYVKVDEVT